MELWIRSQDKKILKKCCFIEIHELIENEDYILQDDEIDYGRYKTHKRALQVLDEIQELLEQEDYLHIRKSSLNILDDIEEPKYILRSCGLPKVYEMPEE